MAFVGGPPTMEPAKSSSAERGEDSELGVYRGFGPPLASEYL